MVVKHGRSRSRQFTVRTPLVEMLLTKRTSALLTIIVFVVLLATTSPFLVATPADGPPKAESDASMTEFTVTDDMPHDWFERLKVMPAVRKLTIRRLSL